MISEMFNKCKTEVHGKRDTVMTSSKKTFCPTKPIYSQVTKDHIIRLLGTAYANSVDLLDSDWARTLTSWYIEGWKENVKARERHRLIDTLIRTRIRRERAPDPLKINLVVAFAGQKRVLTRKVNMRAK
jgi:hypothetical protein